MAWRGPSGLVLTAALAFGIALSAVSASAQEIASARAGVAEAAELPISARRAFLYSLALPGLGQARLDRPLVGAGFFLVEAFSLALIHRATDDLRLARAFSRDSVPLSFAINRETGVAQLDGNGKPVVAGWEPSRYSADLVQARRLQLEDWTAVLLFNHLIAGAEAFVAAQLWDLPQHVKVRATPVRGGFGIRAQFRTR